VALLDCGGMEVEKSREGRNLWVQMNREVELRTTA